MVKCRYWLGQRDYIHHSRFTAPFRGIRQSYAWNWNGPQSLWIDFRTLKNFGGGDFAWLGPTFGANASSLQIFGYDAAMSLTGATSSFILSSNMTPIVASLTSIRFLEIRSNSNGRWFSADNLIVNETPLPAALPLFGTGLGIMGLVSWWRKRRAEAVA